MCNISYTHHTISLPTFRPLSLSSPLPSPNVSPSLYSLPLLHSRNQSSSLSSPSSSAWPATEAPRVCTPSPFGHHSFTISSKPNLNSSPFTIAGHRRKPHCGRRRRPCCVAPFPFNSSNHLRPSLPLSLKSKPHILLRFGVAVGVWREKGRTWKKE